MDSSNTLDGRTPAIGWICAGVATAALATAGLGVILMTEAGQLLNLPSTWDSVLVGCEASSCSYLCIRASHSSSFDADGSPA
jgi:hypothetical protein